MDRVLVIDHKDSFVFNLVEEFAKRGAEVRTIRSDTTAERVTEEVGSFDPHLVLLSPGPGRPEEAPATLPWLRTRPSVPVLGVCLGHQALAVAAGGRVERAPRPVHGKSASVELEPDPLFDGLPQRFPAARYHSLAVTEVPEAMRSIASVTEDGGRIVMALRHTTLPQIGFQFHPESFLTPFGGELLARVLDEARAHARSKHGSASAS